MNENYLDYKPETFEENLSVIDNFIKENEINKRLNKPLFQALEIAKLLFKKEIPVKPLVTVDEFSEYISLDINCPFCNTDIYLFTDAYRCPNCGQKLIRIQNIKDIEQEYLRTHEWSYRAGKYVKKKDRKSFR